jgi:hypothetical protein
VSRLSRGIAYSNSAEVEQGILHLIPLFTSGSRRGLNSRENDNRFSAFLTALFEEVYNVIKTGKAGILERIQGCAELSDADKEAALHGYPDSLSGQFRLFMSVGQTFERQGPLRIKFYDSVLREADQASFLYMLRFYLLPKQLYKSVNLSEIPPQQNLPSGKFKKYGPNISEGILHLLINPTPACLDQWFVEVELQTVIQRVWEIVVNSGSPPSTIMVLAFDEAHTLFSSRDQEGGTPYMSLRRALRGMRKHPIWSVFLSTTGKSNQFAPPPHLDPSDRILWGLLLNAIPFTLLGFDQVAKKFQEDMTLADVILPSFRYSLGRPLYVLFRHFCSY